MTVRVVLEFACVLCRFVRAEPPKQGAPKGFPRPPEGWAAYGAAVEVAGIGLAHEQHVCTNCIDKLLLFRNLPTPEKALAP